MKHLIAPSILSADFLHLGDAINMINSSRADWIHVDVMDGHFVPNISFGFPVIKAVKRIARKPLDVHLMIDQPERYLKGFKDAGADILSVHYEKAVHLHRTVSAIRDLRMKPGVVINPHTPVSVMEDILPFVELVLVMSVNPGYGGQKFIETATRKVQQLKALAQQLNPGVMIEVDGGVSKQNAGELIRAGANVLVAGNSIFSQEDPVAAIAELKSIEADTIEA